MVAGADKLDGIAVSTLAVSNKRPRYADEPVPGPWVVAYRFEHDGKALVYAPCLADLPDGFEQFAAGATYVVLDGTFYSAGEMPGQTVMGHLRCGRRSIGSTAGWSSPT